MKKRIGEMLLALFILVSLILGTIPVQAAEATVTLRVHYYRADGKYDDWRVYCWDTDAVLSFEGGYYDFRQEGEEMVATIDKIPSETMGVGYIVSKPFNGMCVEYTNYFIDLDSIISGTVDVYAEPGKDHEVVYGADVVRGAVVATAAYKKANADGFPQVIVKMNSKSGPFELTTDTFSVYNRDGKVTITEVKRVNHYCYLILSEPLDLMRGYLVGFQDQTCVVAMPDIYSAPEFESQYTYTGDDLGVTYTPEKTTLRVWAPTALEMQVNLYEKGDPDMDPDPVSTVTMKADVRGTWVCELPGDQEETYYTYQITTDTTVAEACDPYARTCGVNGQRSMIIDPNPIWVDPPGWEYDTNPAEGYPITDAVIYQLSVPDLSSDSSSGILGKGGYDGMVEEGTENAYGNSTGLDHIEDLGVTHVQLLPIYDVGGDHPVNYRVPEGDYSIIPEYGLSRVTELKQMIKGFHDKQIGVIMELDLGPLENADTFCFNQLVPGYFTNPTSFGDRIASERTMVRKYLVDCVNAWVEEYHIDGFCLNRAWLLDTDTVNEMIRTVHEKYPDVLFYGEGDTVKVRVTKENVTMCNQSNAEMVPDFGFLNDDFCHEVRGVNNTAEAGTGYISGGDISEEQLDRCFMGMAGDSTPSRSFNYISCYDGDTLYDHITRVDKDASQQERIARNKLGAVFTLMAQGVPVLQAGEEFLRSGSGDGNPLRWNTLSQETYQDVYEYYKGLIAFRLSHPSLRRADSASVQEAVKAVSGLPEGVVAYHIQCDVENERADGIFCVFNATQSPVTVSLPQGAWNLFVDGERAGRKPLEEYSGEILIEPLSAAVLAIEEEEILIPPKIHPAWYVIQALKVALVISSIIAVPIFIYKKIKKRRTK